VGFISSSGVSCAQAENNNDVDVSNLLDMYAFQENFNTLGKRALELRRIHELSGISFQKTTILF